ncbi:MAG: Acetyl-CoA:oxalate CoA-transferase [Rhodocyclaceae bacterium]|nr:Acetyl-CoA:oxalate CoA-transferase [Rhodocyclaceae bacterium]
MSAMSPGALEGLKVLDLTQMLAGPYCTQLLADQGAEVIKIEPPEGDMTRTMGPYRADDTRRLWGGYFQSINRNKKSLCIDLKQAEGKAIFMRLVERADVVVENMRVGVMDRLGLGYEQLSARNPRIVYAALRGFGDPRGGATPYQDWPAFDVIAQAMGGIMGITGPDPNTPLKIGPGVGDLVPAIHMAFGIMAGVYRAQKTGQGQFVDVPMVDTILSLCERMVYQYSYENKVAGPEGNRHPILCPFGMFRCKDGWVTIACPTDAFWKQLCELIGRPDLGNDPAFKGNDGRQRHHDRVDEAINGYTMPRTKRELTELLGGKIPFGPVYDVRDIFADEHFRAHDMLVSVEQPGSSTPVQIAGIALRMTGTPGAVVRRAPLLGEDTDAILMEFGANAGDIRRWREQGLVR